VSCVLQGDEDKDEHIGRRSIADAIQSIGDPLGISSKLLPDFLKPNNSSKGGEGQEKDPTEDIPLNQATQAPPPNGETPSPGLSGKDNMYIDEINIYGNRSEDEAQKHYVDLKLPPPLAKPDDGAGFVAKIIRYIFDLFNKFRPKGIIDIMRDFFGLTKFSRSSIMEKIKNLFGNKTNSNDAKDKNNVNPETPTTEQPQNDDESKPKSIIDKIRQLFKGKSNGENSETTTEAPEQTERPSSSSMDNNGNEEEKKTTTTEEPDATTEEPPQQTEEPLSGNDGEGPLDKILSMGNKDNPLAKAGSFLGLRKRQSDGNGRWGKIFSAVQKFFGRKEDSEGNFENPLDQYFEGKPHAVPPPDPLYNPRQAYINFYATSTPRTPYKQSKLEQSQFPPNNAAG